MFTVNEIEKHSNMKLNAEGSDPLDVHSRMQVLLGGLIILKEECNIIFMCCASYCIAFCCNL